MAWDSEGNLKVAWIGVYGTYYALLYGERTGTEWNVTYLSRLFYEHRGASLALDSQDQAYVCTSCREGADMTTLGPSIIFATNAGGAWTVELINTTGYCGSAHVAVDASDVVHLISSQPSRPYDYLNYTLVDMVRTAEGWESTTLRTVQGPDSHIHVYDVESRPDGTIGIVYSSSDDTSDSPRLNYSVYSDGELFDSTVIDPFEGYAGLPSLCHDSAGNAYISMHATDTEGLSVCFFTNSEGAWVRTDVAYGGYGRSDISVGDDGSIYIGFFVSSFDGESYNHTVRYCTNVDGTWNTRIIDDCDGWPGQESIAILPDRQNNVHISYFQRVSDTEHGDRSVTVYLTSELDDSRYEAIVIESVVSAASVGILAVAILLLIRRRQVVSKRKMDHMDSVGLYE